VLVTSDSPSQVGGSVDASGVAFSNSVVQQTPPDSPTEVQGLSNCLASAADCNDYKTKVTRPATSEVCL
jgi:hypothetical protein